MKKFLTIFLISIASITYCEANPGDSLLIANLKGDIKHLIDSISSLKDANGAIIQGNIIILNKYEQMFYLLESAEKQPFNQRYFRKADVKTEKVRLCLEIIAPTGDAIEYYSRLLMNIEGLEKLIRKKMKI